MLTGAGKPHYRVLTQCYESHRVDGDLLLYPTNERRSDSIILLNAVGRMVYEGLCRSESIEEIVASLLERYEVSEDEAKGDVEKCVGLLLENRAIEMVA